MFKRCEVCNKRTVVQDWGLPGIAATAKLCFLCQAVNAVPLDILVERTAGMRERPDWWFEVIHASLHRIGLCCKDFETMVKACRDTAAWDGTVSLISQRGSSEKLGHDGTRSSDPGSGPRQ